MKLTHYPNNEPPAWASHRSDAFAQPRDPITAIHGATEGAWTYRTIAPSDVVLPEWQVVYQCADRVLIKYTHWERTHP